MQDQSKDSSKYEFEDIKLKLPGAEVHLMDKQGNLVKPKAVDTVAQAKADLARSQVPQTMDVPNPDKEFYLKKK